MISRLRRAKPPEAAGPTQAGQAAEENPSSPSIAGATSTAPDQRGATLPPPLPLLLPDDKWLPPPPFRTSSGLGSVGSAQGTPHRPRYSWRDGPCAGLWDPQMVVSDMAAALAADRVYASVDELSAAFHAQLSTLTCVPAFHTCQRAFIPRLSGFLETAQGPRNV